VQSAEIPEKMVLSFGASPFGLSAKDVVAEALRQRLVKKKRAAYVIQPAAIDRLV